ncbi:MAG: tRNA (adenosine(37)-N6)-threonylcarbamoyltransferase complex ATPase subunit type 1 TsaE [Pseudomonadales bacterium]
MALTEGRSVGGRSESAWLADEAATVAFGARLAARLRPGMLVYLHGDLGAGKTTLARGILRALGHSGAVKSPTYTLLEPYELPSYLVYHFDFYRIVDPQELDFIGVDELLDSAAIKLVEWPERVAGQLPAADLVVRMRVAGEGRRIEMEFRA